MTEIKRENSIAVFDSGLGGISVLHELISLMPNEDYIYFGDSLHAPYGIKSKEEITALCEDTLKLLLKQDIKCVVIACNTATAAAAKALRAAYPELSIIGMEPAVKPAASCGRHPRVLVLATPVTIHGERLHKLLLAHQAEADFLLLEAPDIVSFVEAGISDRNPTEELKAYFDRLLAPYSGSEGDADQIDAVVLGCTHFPFVKESIRAAFPYPVKLFDGAKGTALQTRRLLLQKDLCRKEMRQGTVTLLNSDPEKLGLEKQLLKSLQGSGSGLK